MQTTQSRFIRGTLILAVGIGVLTAACGTSDDNDKAATTKAPASAVRAAFTGDPESAYCATARQWAVHEVAPIDEGDPVAFRSYWTEYITFNHTAKDQAPAELKDEWMLSSDAIDATLTPIFEKYGYDMQRLGTEGTDEEKSHSEPPPDVAEAQGTIHRYESEVCAAGQPPAADVDFSKEKASAAYCKVVGEDAEMTEGVIGQGPAAIRELATSKEFLAMLQRLHDTAPAVIKADAAAVYEFTTDRQLPMLERRGYDFDRILLDGPHADRELLNSTSAEVREHSARLTAYEEQLCGGEE